MFRHKIGLILLLSFSVFGCAKLQHLDQLLTLKSLSDEQAAMEKYIKSQDEKFDLLVKAVHDKSIEQYTKKISIVRKFGDPVYCRDRDRDGQNLQFCLYRYSKKYFNSDKVYFYFDQKDKLIEWEYIPLQTTPEQQAAK